MAVAARRLQHVAAARMSRILTSSLRNGFAVIARGACEASVSKDGRNVRTRGHPSRRAQGRTPQDEVGDILTSSNTGTTVERLRPHYERDFVAAGAVTGAAGGAGAGAAVTILSDFSSSGLKTNSLSCGVSMACTQTCKLTPMSAR